MWGKTWHSKSETSSFDLSPGYSIQCPAKFIWLSFYSHFHPISQIHFGLQPACCMHAVCYLCQETVYGTRDGVLPGLAVVSRAEKTNCFRRSTAFKTGVIRSVAMLGRQHMKKPDVSGLNLPTPSINNRMPNQYYHYRIMISKNTFQLFLGGPVIAQAPSSRPHLGRAMTDVQELKQVSHASKKT